jgi:putrescine transport system substrate-binding protein
MMTPIRAAICGSLLALLTACGSGSAPQSADSPAGDVGEGGAQSGGAEPAVLNVYNWSDYIDPSVLEDFTAETGIRVTYDVFDSNEMLETKLFAGRSGYDLVVPGAAFLARQIQAGVYQPLNPQWLENRKNLDPVLTERVAAFDPDNRYSVTHLWGTTGFGFNAEAIAARMPDAPVDSWRLIFDPDVVSRFADCGVTLLDAPSEVVGSVLLYLGKDANSAKAEDLAAAEAVLQSIRPYVRNFDSSRYIEDLANGETCLALGWSGDILQAKRRATEAGKSLTVEYRIPEEGALLFFDQLAIPADAAHPRNAHRFIDFLLRPQIAARNSNFVRYANSNLASRDLLAPQVANDRGIYPPESIMARTAVDLPKDLRHTRELTRLYTRVKAGRP